MSKVVKVEAKVDLYITVPDDASDDDVYSFLVENISYYRVTFELVLDDEAGHPRKWVPQAVWDALRPTEDATNWQYEELEDAAAE
jgi:hypothetical protein